MDKFKIQIHPKPAIIIEIFRLEGYQMLNHGNIKKIDLNKIPI
jgi:hypothetical protein